MLPEKDFFCRRSLADAEAAGDGHSGGARVSVRARRGIFSRGAYQVIVDGPAGFSAFSGTLDEVAVSVRLSQPAGLDAVVRLLRKASESLGEQSPLLP
jgi:hypothetical protein